MNFAKIISFGIISMVVPTGFASACSGSNSLYQLLDVDPRFHEPAVIEVFESDDLDGFFPMSYGKFCSFAYAGQGDDVFATPAGDVGNGFIAQTIIRESGCSPRTDLVVTDCNSLEAVLLNGKGSPDEDGPQIDGFFPDYIGHHLTPVGQLDVAGAINMSSLVEEARAIGLRVEIHTANDPLTTVFMEPDTIDPYCGCKIYYPDSAGATN